MKTTLTRIGIGVATTIAGSALLLGSLAAAAGTQPARVCLDNASASQCISVVLPQAAPGGGSGDLVAVNLPDPGRLDAKDHPNYGQVTTDSPGRLDAKDHPNYGQVTTESAGRGDAKDHPNY